MFPHRITVEPYAGDSAYGPTYGPPLLDVAALVTPATRSVRDAQGRDTLSTAQILTETGLDCPAESRITLPDGRTTRVLAVTEHTAPGLPLPQSKEVVCE
ncbi:MULTISPECIES: hypothetical protein [Streptomyces]|uniref:hypothetical protein n=1 Tax=Streptomyces TaxID=1883 RepID=UPI001F3A77D9|nr:hypothetical protein [Streptomyces sp. CB02120-2]